MPKFSKAVYEMVAQNIYEVYTEVSTLEGVPITTLAKKFGDVFEKDNPRFDRHKYTIACVIGKKKEEKEDG